MERNIGGRISQFLASTILLGPQPVSNGAVGLLLLNFSLLSSSASQRKEQSMRGKKERGIPHRGQLMSDGSDVATLHPQTNEM
jgi:hypothetical protein